MPARRSAARNPPMGICDVCQTPGTQFQHISDNDASLVAIAEALGFQTSDDYCNSCMDNLKGRLAAVQRETMNYSSVESNDASLPPTSQASQRDVVRLSEMPLPISPRPESSSESMNDTVDRMVRKRPRVNKSTVDQLASQSLSVDESSTQERTPSRRPPASPPVVPPTRSSQSISLPAVASQDNSSPDHSQRAPPPKNPRPRVRPAGRQFATGVLELPLNVQRRMLPEDLPRAISG